MRTYIHTHIHTYIRFHIMAPSAIGALTLGTLISTRENEETMKFGFELYKSLLPENAFFGRGPNMGPKFALTDDANAERNALKHTLPAMILLLCLFRTEENQFHRIRGTRYLTIVNTMHSVVLIWVIIEHQNWLIKNQSICFLKLTLMYREWMF